MKLGSISAGNKPNFLFGSSICIYIFLIEANKGARKFSYYDKMSRRNAKIEEVIKSGLVM